MVKLVDELPGETPQPCFHVCQRATESMMDNIIMFGRQWEPCGIVINVLC